MSFGDAGPYERLLGKVHFAIDPTSPACPTSSTWTWRRERRGPGRVRRHPRHRQAGRPRTGQRPPLLRIQQPRQPGPDHRLQLRPRRRHEQPGVLPAMASSCAGIHPCWSGWQGDLIDQGGNVVAYLPYATEDGKPLRGRVRQEFNPTERACRSAPAPAPRAAPTFSPTPWSTSRPPP